MDNVDEEQIVVYTDCGDLLLFGVDTFVADYMQKRNFLFIRGNYSHRLYTKKYLFTAMNCMNDKYLTANQLEAGFIAITVNNTTRNFIHEWECLCVNPDYILDYPIDDEWPDLIRHSRDQSILTNLQLKYDIDTIDINKLSNKFIVFNYRR